MNPASDDPVLAYHDATKHHPRRYARSRGFLDWSTQPDPFRRFTGAPLVPMAIPDERAGPEYDDLFRPGAIAPARLDADSLSRFFYLSLAVSAWKQAGGSRWALRCNPSSGNLHPTEGYVVLPAIERLGDAPGLYHYAPREHALERRCEWEEASWEEVQAGNAAGLFFVGLSSIYWREAWKYGERAFRYCQLDVGHALGALRLAAAALGWRLAILDELGDLQISRLLGLDREEDFKEAECEHPELMAAVWPNDTPPRAGTRPACFDRVRVTRWHGRANRLSSGHVPWGIIDEVAAATLKPPGAQGRQRRVDHQPSPQCLKSPRRPGLSACQVIRQRRSAVGFDGRTAIAAATFYHMLQRVSLVSGSGDARHEDGSSAPWDALPWRPCMDLMLFVHRVEELAPGVYAFVREAQRADRLRSAMRPGFAWARPQGCPGDLELYQLVEGDCRELAAQLSLGQAIAGDSAFSLGMVADFESALRAHGPWFYRSLYWEAGFIGQLLYLEAEAAGVRATGIGAYFDDLVHELAGLSGPTFQSLYHFTVGGPVEDRRITTLPA